MLKHLLACAIGLIFLSFARAGDGGVDHFEKQAPYSDTADKKDSLAQQDKQENSSKEEFKAILTNLSTSSTGTSINIQQINPQAISFVEDYIEKFGETMTEMKGWGKPYFDMMDAILVEHNLPKELKYLAVIESNLKTNAKSWAGAVGPWQFMPATARTMGLKVGRKYDERRDFNKSTHAAARYLTDLFELYNDWLLVIAAYNGGPGRVNSAIKKSGSTDFWVLQKYLPTESKNHVKKFIATHYIIEGQGSVTTVTKEQAKMLTAPSPEETANSKAHPISGRYNSSVIVKHITMDIAAFQRLNPDFDKLIGSIGKYELHLPADKMGVFLAKKEEILNESLQLLLQPVNESSN